MSINLTFDGSTEARGRNGWFQLHRIYIHPGRHYPLEGEPTPTVGVWVYSKRYGKMPPILLQFHNSEELRTLICGLSKAYAQMLTREEEV